MIDLEVPDDKSSEVVQPEVSALPEIGETSAAVRLLFTNGSIEDADDRKIIEDALGFLENPTEDIDETEHHSRGIVQILAYNYAYQSMEGQPPALSDINRRLFQLISEQRIKLIEAELKTSYPDIAKIEALIAAAHNSTGVLVEFYHDNVLRDRVEELREQLEIIS